MSTESNEEAKKTLVSKRRGHKAYATKLMNDAKLLLSSDNPSRVKLTTFLKTLTDRKEIIVTLDNEILSTLIEAEMTDEIMTSGDYIMSIDEVIFSISDVLDNFAMNDEERKSLPDLEDERRGSAKLPKLLLKKFSGDILRFQEFWECFDSAVHTNSSIDKVMKYNYLRSLLEGDAAATIAGLSLTSENYVEAISLLRSRYGNKQVLISAHIDKLLNLSYVSTNSDVKLRELHDAIEINVRGLKNLDITSSHYGPILVSIVMSKLPDDIKLIVSRSMSSSTTEESKNEWKIDELMKSFKQELESREMCNFVSSTSNVKQRNLIHPKGSQRHH